MDTKVKIPFAEQTGKIVHISEVENGLLCNCKCCYCGAQLIAKNNKDNIRESHFAHYNSDDCGKSLETSIHKAAKQYLLETKKIILPDIFYYDKINQITFEKVELEKTINYEDSSIKVDALGYINNKHKIIIEFAVTHYSSEKKKQIFNKLKIPTVEVYLPISCNSFEAIKLILQEDGFKEWLYYPLQDNPKLNSFVKKYKSEIDGLKHNVKSLSNENNSLKTELHNARLKFEKVYDGKITDSFIGIGWGPKLERPINLSINKEDLDGIKTDRYKNFRFVIYNSKTLDRTKSNLKVFVDKEFFKKFNR